MTEILVDDSTNRPKSILKNQGSQITAPQSPPKDQPVNPIRAGILLSSTMDVAPDCHQHENITCRTTTEAVDLAQPAINTEPTPSKPKTRRIKRSLLLEPLSCDETPISPSSLHSQSEDEVEDTQPIMAAETNMQPESQSGVANCTPQQDKSRSYPSEQTAEYPRQNHTTRGTSTPSSETIGSPKMKSRTLDPQRPPQRTCNLDPHRCCKRHTATGRIPVLPTAQIAEYLRRDPVTNEQCIPIFSAVTLKKKKMFFALMDLKDLTLDALIDSGAFVNCISETDYNKIFQISPNDIVKELEPPPSNSKSRTAISKPPQRQSSSNSRSGTGTSKRHLSLQNDSQAQYSASLFSRITAPSWT